MNKLKIAIFVIVTISVVVIFGIATTLEYNNNSKNTAVVVEEKKKEEQQEKEKQKPVLELTQDSVSLEVGSQFFYEDYIKKAEDENGFNLKDFVKGPKNIETDVPGKFKVTYRLELPNGDSISRDLLVDVVQFSKGDHPD